ncbi:BAX inhibitor (BI)-1/YccA family protein [Candidatus Pacearchaeota archaeon]|nr:MAG: BAX inhibitor (BI)-1/YccA family protein [Candidatus Pacearchaeota archaeon]
MPQKQVSEVFRKVYYWMFLGLLLSGIAAYLALSTPLKLIIFGNMWIFFGLIILELIFVVAISGIIKKLPAKTAKTLFFFYSFLNGLTLSLIFLVYTSSSIVLVFFITASMFGIMALYGFFTKYDLSKLGPVFFMALIGLIISLVVNMFFKSSQFDFIISILGVIIFSALIMYDNQKIKKIALSVRNKTQLERYAVIATLGLYLDFINLFLFLLRLFGERKR